MFANDLLYIVQHPLIQSMIRRRAELEERAVTLPQGCAERKELKRRIAKLEPYILPKPTPDGQQMEPIFGNNGQKIGERGSIRRRVVYVRRGRGEEYGIKTRAALEEKLEKGLAWRELATKHKFPDAATLERAVRRLKNVLKAEEIELPVFHTGKE